MIVEKDFENKDQKVKLHAEAQVINLGFRKKNRLRSKYVEPKLSMQGKDMIIKDIPVDAFSMVEEAMTSTVNYITLDGQWIMEDPETGEETAETFKGEDKIKITKEEDWDALPICVSEWLFAVVMEKLFREQGSTTANSSGGARVPDKDPLPEGVQPKLQGDGRSSEPDDPEASG